METHSHRVISADAHTVEPPDLWEKWLEAKYRDTAPKLVAACRRRVLVPLIVGLGGGTASTEESPARKSVARGRPETARLIPMGR